MDRVHQGPAGTVFMIKQVQIVAADFKGGYALGRVFDPDSAQVATLAQKKRAYEDVRGLVMGDRSSPPFCVPRLIFSGRYDRKRKSFQGIYPLEYLYKAIDFRTAKLEKSVAFFFRKIPLSKTCQVEYMQIYISYTQN